jgi:predicted anti-sigma-YlaC factor YlaD
MSNEALEQYAMRTLSRQKLKSVEEHLLTCSPCRGRLQAMDDYVAAMRAASRKIRKVRGRLGQTG